LVYGIFGDIHGNHDALKAVLAALGDLEVDAYVCLGDVVGYAAEPNRCVEAVRSLGCAVVAGNHDYSVVEKEKTEFFNPFAREAILWTRSQLTPDNRAYLAELELVWSSPDFLSVHANLDRPEEFFYLDNPMDAAITFDLMNMDLLFVGHTHIPVNFVARRSGGSVTYNRNSVLNLANGFRYIVNVGSVGQPRDSDWRAAFATFDTKKRIVRLHRIEYDVETAVEKIYRAGLPRINADRLFMGR